MEEDDLYALAEDAEKAAVQPSRLVTAAAAPVPKAAAAGGAPDPFEVWDSPSALQIGPHSPRNRKSCGGRSGYAARLYAYRWPS